jgi:hypothetical protein
VDVFTRYLLANLSSSSPQPSSSFALSSHGRHSSVSTTFQVLLSLARIAKLLQLLPILFYLSISIFTSSYTFLGVEGDTSFLFLLFMAALVIVI